MGLPHPLRGFVQLTYSAKKRETDLVSLYFLAEDKRHVVAKTIAITKFQHLNLFPPPIYLHFYLPLFSGIQSICLVFLLFYPSFHKRTINTRVRLSCVYSAFSYLAFLPFPTRTILFASCNFFNTRYA